MSTAPDLASGEGRVGSDEILKQAARLPHSTDRPVYAVIAEWLGQLITFGELARGQRLPSERKLADALSVSRMTLRQALDQLQNAGQIVRLVGGGGGSFVAEQRLSVDVSNLTGLSAQLLQSVDNAFSQVVSARTVEAPPAAVHALALATGGKAHEIVRVRFAATAPVVLEHSFFPAGLFPDMLEHDLTGSLYGLIDECYRRAPQSADAELRPAFIVGEDAELMHVKNHSLVQHILRTARSADGTPVEYSEDLFRTDLLRIMVSGQMLATQV